MFNQSKTIFKKIFWGLILGLFTGYFVVYLSNTPFLSLVNTSIKACGNNNEDIEIGLYFENKSRSTADNVSTKVVFGIAGQDVNDFIPAWAKRHYEIVEAGGVLYKRICIPIHELPIQEGNIILLLQTEFKDTSRLREIFNKLVPGEEYKIYRLAQYIKGEENLYYPEEGQIEKYQKNLINKLNQVTEWRQE